MRTEIEEHWKKSNQYTCQGKTSFPSFRLAAEYNNHIRKPSSAARAKGKKLEKLRPYRCTRCYLYHLGHDVRQRQARLKRQRQQLRLQQRLDAEDAFQT